MVNTADWIGFENGQLQPRPLCYKTKTEQAAKTTRWPLNSTMGGKHSRKRRQSIFVTCHAALFPFPFRRPFRVFGHFVSPNSGPTLWFRIIKRGMSRQGVSGLGEEVDAEVVLDLTGGPVSSRIT